MEIKTKMELYQECVLNNDLKEALTKWVAVDDILNILNDESLDSEETISKILSEISELSEAQNGN